MRLLAGSPTSNDPDAGMQSCVDDSAARKQRLDRKIDARAQGRGEIEPDRDLDLLASVLPAVMMQCESTSGLSADLAVMYRIFDELVMPAVRA
jgi:hypothetical protein